jgi:BirA family biotin operon repressor/biotin-[acetyl-CoA-carboxylase] ligase
VLLRPPASANAPELSLVGGVAVALTVERALGRASQLKWPNDVLVDGRKIAGVLGEVRSTAVVLGIGLNVNQDVGELPRGPALPPTSLFVVDGSRRLRAPLLAGLLLDLEDLYARWELGGLAALTGEISARDYLRGRLVAVGDVEGTALGIAPDGQLEIETAGGPRRVASGDVTVEQPA